MKQHSLRLVQKLFFDSKLQLNFQKSHTWELQNEFRLVFPVDKNEVNWYTGGNDGNTDSYIKEIMNANFKSKRVQEVDIPVSTGLATMGTMVMNMVAKM